MQRFLAGAAVIALALAVAGCGGGKSARQQVSAYFKQVNAIQQRMATPISNANIAFRRFSVQGISPKELRDLRTARATILLLHARLQRLHAPKQAAQIHRDLLRLVSMQASFAGDVLQLAAYGPKLTSVMTHVSSVGKRLQAGLKSKSATTQAQAFRTYAAALSTDADRLDRLAAPKVAVPTQSGEAARLRKTAAVSRKIAVTLKPIPPPAPLPKKKRRDKAAIARYNREAKAYQSAVLARRRTLNMLLGQLSSVSSLAERRRVRAEEVKAVKAFDHRLAVIGKLAARIDRERIQLERRL